MILANNKTRKSHQTFNNIKEFNQACEFHDLDLIDENYIPGKEIESSGDIETIEITRITPEFNINEYSVKVFRDNLENFSDEQLQIFVDTDSRATIIKEAKKELNKRK